MDERSGVSGLEPNRPFPPWLAFFGLHIPAHTADELL